MDIHNEGFKGSGFIHSDIKPDAILCHRDDRKGLNVKLADFGSAYDGKMTKRQEYEAVFYRGNFMTAAPEIFKNEMFGKPADIWAFGATIAFVCNRRYPFQDKKTTITWSDLQKPFLDDFEKYSGNLNLLVMSMMNLDPRRRPSAQKIWSK